MGFFSSLFGKKVKLPAFEPVDFDKEYDAAFAYNKKKLPEFADLAKSIQSMDQETLMQGIRSVMPDYDASVKSQADIQESLLRGEMTEQEKRDAWDTRAEIGLAQGLQDSDRVKHDYARDLGITRRQNIMTGLNLLQSRLSQSRQLTVDGPRVVSFFQDARSRIEQKMQERNAKLARDSQQARYDAQGNPITQGIVGGILSAAGAGAFDNFSSMTGGQRFGTILGSTLGFGGAQLGGQLGGFLGGAGAATGGLPFGASGMASQPVYAPWGISQPQGYGWNMGQSYQNNPAWLVAPQDQAIPQLPL